MSSNIRGPAKLRLKQITAHVTQPQITDYPIPHYATTTPTTLLKGKVAIITGCNSDKGIGRATAIIFAANGARAIVICDLVSSNLPTWADEIGKRYPNTVVEWSKFDASGSSKHFDTDIRRNGSKESRRVYEPFMKSQLIL
jgi:hypothetical protein